ncbi:MAG: hypothetical protein ACXAC7_02760 [Candidatus Hodarchaeales archaeon]
MIKSKDIFFADLHSSDWKKRLHAVEKLGDLSTDYPEQVFPALFASLTDNEPYVRMLASIYIKNVPTKLILNQINDLVNGNDGMRFTGLIACEEIDEPFLLPLLKQINDPEELFQQQVIRLIERLEKYK